MLVELLGLLVFVLFPFGFDGEFVGFDGPFVGFDGEFVGFDGPFVGFDGEFVGFDGGFTELPVDVFGFDVLPLLTGFFIVFPVELDEDDEDELPGFFIVFPVKLDGGLLVDDPPLGFDVLDPPPTGLFTFEELEELPPGFDELDAPPTGLFELDELELPPGFDVGGFVGFGGFGGFFIGTLNFA